jgi:FtsZ-binding cell division protein ZapB
VSVHASDVFVSIAQVAAGGGLVQGIMAFLRRRTELRQLDTASDNVIVGTAKDVIELLHAELNGAKNEIKQLKDERADMQRQITRLGEDVSNVRAENVVMKAEIARLQEG